MNRSSPHPYFDGSLAHTATERTQLDALAHATLQQAKASERTASNAAAALEYATPRLGPQSARRGSALRSGAMRPNEPEGVPNALTGT